MMNTYTKLLLTLITTMVLGIANGAGLPASYPSDGFDRIGNVDSINFETRQVVINDMIYILSDDAVLNSLSKSSDSMGRLIKDTKVGFNFSNAGKHRYIREIWLLPSTYTPTEGSIKGIDGPIEPGLLK